MDRIVSSFGASFGAHSPLLSRPLDPPISPVQIIESSSEDQAIEDAVLVLDRALQAGIAGLTAEAYLKQVWTV